MQFNIQHVFILINLTNAIMLSLKAVPDEPGNEEAKVLAVVSGLRSALPQIEAVAGRDLIDDEKATVALHDAAVAIVRTLQAVKSVIAAIDDAKAKAPALAAPK